MDDTLFQEIELVDALLYLYIIFGWINMSLCIIFLFIIFRNWQNASRAVNPSQYKLRNKYIISLILTIIGNLIHAITIVFGVNDLIIPWNYNTLPHIYQEIFIFFLCFGTFAFICSMLVSFLIRVSILYQLNKIQSIILNSFTFLIMISIVIMAIIVSIDGVNLAHCRDESSGISILRAIEKSVSIMFMYILLPLSVLGFILFSFIYSYKMKLLKTVSLKKERDLLMPIVLKESILVLSACTVSIVFGFCMSFILNDNISLFASTSFGLMLICIFLMFDFNHNIFYKFCYYPSLCWLNVCCLHAKKENDENLLSIQCTSQFNYSDVPQELNFNDKDDFDDDAKETEDDSLIENDP